MRDSHCWFIVVLGDEVVAVSERAAGADDYLHACFLGGEDDFCVALEAVGVCVFLKDKVHDVPCGEEFGEEGLRRFSEKEEFGCGVEFGEVFEEVVFAVYSTGVLWLEVSLSRWEDGVGTEIASD